jgi:hypothetical protein
MPEMHAAGDLEEGARPKFIQHLDGEDLAEVRYPLAILTVGGGHRGQACYVGAVAVLVEGVRIVMDAILPPDDFACQVGVRVVDPGVDDRDGWGGVDRVPSEAVLRITR